MRSIIIGLGIQGKKRRAVAADSIIAVVDPIHTEADFKDIRDVDLASYDAAYVCTPDEPKFEILSYLLSNKKHALVEKPILSSSNDEIEELIRLSDKNNTTCYTAYNHRFEPHFVAIKNIIAEGSLGKPYLLKMFYGNGTARDVKNSVWRDKGLGVLPDIGSHLLDTILFFFNDLKISFKPMQAHCMENNSLDYFMIGTDSKSPSITLEATLLSWKNTFRLDLLCEKGSAHIDCLCKWGPSSLIIRNRVLPSGKPDEKIETLTCKDPTWEIENKYFLKLCQTGANNLKNDLWVNSKLLEIGRDLATENRIYTLSDKSI